MSQLDFILSQPAGAGVLLRDRGQRTAREHTEEITPGWVERTIKALETFCADLRAKGHSEFVMEDFRATRMNDIPASVNAWGSIPVIAARRGIIRFTGAYQNAKHEKAHARAVKVWSIIGG